MVELEMLHLLNGLSSRQISQFRVPAESCLANMAQHIVRPPPLVWWEIASEPDSLGKFAGARQRS